MSSAAIWDDLGRDTVASMPPNSSPFRRFKPICVIIWRTWAHVSGVVTATALLSWGLLAGTASDGPVWETESFRLVTPVVRATGEMVYTATITAKESCPGRVTHSMVDSEGKSTIVLQRPLIQPGISVTERTFTVPLPQSIHIGMWKVVLAIDSQCPTRHQLDELARFEIVVTP